MPDLRKGQYKRLGRIAENNPERAERVADRMEKRASREERGKEFVENKPAREKNKRDFEQGVARLYGGGDKADAKYRPKANAEEKNFAQGVAKLYDGVEMKKQQAVRRFSTQAEEHRTNSSHEQARKRDTPLSTTPEPMSQMRGKLIK